MEQDLQTIKKNLQKEQRQLKRAKFLHNRLAMTGAVLIVLVTVLALAAPLPEC